MLQLEWFELIFQVVAEHLSIEEVADIKNMFEKMDINKKGRITLEELKSGLHKLGHQIPDADVQILMNAVQCWIFLSNDPALF